MLLDDRNRSSEFDLVLFDFEKLQEVLSAKGKRKTQQYLRPIDTANSANASRLLVGFGGVRLLFQYIRRAVYFRRPP
jgi:hypothetical protein